MTDRKLDEWADHRTSPRITGKERLWGFLRAGVFHALWWDPEHELHLSKRSRRESGSWGFSDKKSMLWM